MWAERGIRSWAEGWWASPMRVGDQIGRIVGAPAGSTVDAAERCHRGGDRALLLPAGRPFEEPRRLRARELPVRALPLPGAARPRGRRVRGRRGDRGAHRRADAPRSDQPCPLQGVGDPGRRADRATRARGGRARDPRLLPVRRDRARRRDGSRCRLRGRRLGEVALRRAGERLAVRAARSRRAARADLYGVAGARAAVRVRGGDGVRVGLGALPDGDAESGGAHGGDGRVRPGRGDRCRSHPRELARADAAAHRPRGRGRNRGATAVGSPSDAEVP